MIRRQPTRAALALLCVLFLAQPALAHGGSLRLGTAPPPVPFWLVSVTGGAVIGGSFLFTTLVTDRELIDDVAGLRRALPGGRDASAAARWLAVLALGVVVLVGILGPPTGSANLAVLVVWVAWWAGFTATTYLVGNAWPALNPWRALADLLPSKGVSLPAWSGRASTLGLLGLVFLEVVSPLSTDPRLLAGAVIVYTGVTVAGAVRHGRPWFDRVDPVSRVFATYGRVAPIRREGGGLALSLPGAGLIRRPADATFVVALLWATTFDGLVATAAWASFARAAVSWGVPPLVVYAIAMAAGFCLFAVAFRLACRSARRTADTYVTADELARRFAPSLVPIAAGYHLAHYLGYLLTFVPTLGVVVADPLSPPAALPTLVLPATFSAVPVLAIVGGHLLAVGVAHAVAFDLFVGRLQPLRSQYPFIIVMITYTVVSLWLVSQPTVEPPFV